MLHLFNRLLNRNQKKTWEKRKEHTLLRDSGVWPWEKTNKNLEKTRKKRNKQQDCRPLTILVFCFFGFSRGFLFFLEEMLKNLKNSPQKRYAHDLFTNKMSLRLHTVYSSLLHIWKHQTFCIEQSGPEFPRYPDDMLQNPENSSGCRYIENSQGRASTYDDGYWGSSRGRCDREGNFTKRRGRVVGWVSLWHSKVYLPRPRMFFRRLMFFSGRFGAIAPRVWCFPSGDWRPGWRSRVWKSQIIPYPRWVSNIFLFFTVTWKIIQFDMLLLFNWGGEKPSTRILKIYPPKNYQIAPEDGPFAPKERRDRLSIRGENSPSESHLFSGAI